MNIISKFIYTKALAAFGLCLLFFAAGAFAGVYQDSQDLYSLEYSDQWERVDFDDKGGLSLVCHCATEIQAFVFASYSPKLANLDPEAFFENIPPTLVAIMVAPFVILDGEITQNYTAVRLPVGNTEGYIERYSLKMADGPSQDLIYGLVFNAGYFYHIQIFGPPKQLDAQITDVDELLAGFRLE